MESRVTPRKTPTPRSYDHIQKYLLHHSDIFVTYLRQLTRGLNHIGEAFAHGRVFFPIETLALEDPDSLNQIEIILNDDALLEHLGKRLRFWKPNFDIAGIEEARLFFHEYYFLPIEQSDLYKAFMQEQSQLAPQLSETQIGRLLCGAVVFRLVGQWTIRNPGTLTEKASLLCKLFNTAEDTMTLRQKLETLLISFITNMLSNLEVQLKTCDNKKEARRCIDLVFNKIFSDWHFAGFGQHSHVLFAKFLALMFADLPEEQQKYSANSLFSYCVNHFTADNTEMKTLVKRILPLVTKKSMYENSDLSAFLNELQDEVQKRSESAPAMKKKKSGHFLSNLWHASSKQKKPAPTTSPDLTSTTSPAIPAAIPAAQRVRSPSTPRPVRKELTPPVLELKQAESGSIPPLPAALLAPVFDDASLPSPLPRTPGRVHQRRKDMRRGVSLAELFPSKKSDEVTPSADSSDSESTPRQLKD